VYEERFLSIGKECRGRSSLPGCVIFSPTHLFAVVGVQRTKSFAGVWGVPTNSSIRRRRRREK
jgi:hypothetical protein